MKASKGVQGARDAGIGAAAAALVTAVICRIFPDLDYSAAFTFVLVVGSGLSRMLWNARKHRSHRGTVPKNKLPILILFLPFLLSACSRTITATGGALADVVTAEGIYSLKARGMESEYTNIGAGFTQITEGSLPLPYVGYHRVRLFLFAVPLDDDDAVQYIAERNVQIQANPDGSTVYSGSRTILHSDKQDYLTPAETTCP